MLIGKRLKLRLLEDSDLALIVAWRNDPTNWRSFFNKFPLTLSGQKGFFDALLKNESRKFFMICTLEGKPYGTLSLDKIDFPNRTAEIGNVLIGDLSMRGQGLGREAVALLVDYAAYRLNLHRLWLQVLADNTAAINTYKAAGFVEEGRHRDMIFDEGKYKDVLTLAKLL